MSYQDERAWSAIKIGSSLPWGAYNKRNDFHVYHSIVDFVTSGKENSKIQFDYLNNYQTTMGSNKTRPLLKPGRTNIPLTNDSHNNIITKQKQRSWWTWIVCRDISNWWSTSTSWAMHLKQPLWTVHDIDLDLWYVRCHSNRWTSFRAHLLHQELAMLTTNCIVEKHICP